MKRKISFFIEGTFTLNSLKALGISDNHLAQIEDALRLPVGKRNDFLYYVGILEFGYNLVIVFPKVFTRLHLSLSQARLLVDLLIEVSQNRAILNRLPDSYLLSDSAEVYGLTRFNIARFLFNDFLENGELVFRDRTSLANNSRSIDWNKTISRINPIITAEGAFYNQWISSINSKHADWQINQIYTSVLAECIELYGDLLGAELRDFPFKSSSDNLLVHAENFINAKLRNVFDHRNTHVLRSLTHWLTKKSNKSSLNFFGTKYFHVIWEEICSFLFNNVKSASHWQGVMNRPVWTNIITNQVKHGSSFQVDILSENDSFLILADAKYYSVFDMNSLPGISDISKQMHYELILLNSKSFNLRYNRNVLFNIFLFPAEHEAVLSKFNHRLEYKEITDRNIYGVTLDCTIAFQRYIAKKSLSRDEICNIVASLH